MTSMMELKEMMIFVMYFLCELLGMSAGESTVVNAVRGQTVELMCSARTFNDTVVWTTPYSGVQIPITSCEGNQIDCEVIVVDSRFGNFDATRNDTVSTLRIYDTDQNGVFECKLNGTPVKYFKVNVIDPKDIHPPLCTVSPTFGSHESKFTTVKFHCLSQVDQNITQTLQITVAGLTERSNSTQCTYPIEHQLYKKSSDGFCKMSISGTHLTKNCTFPSHVDVISITKGRDLEFECAPRQDEVGFIDWRLLMPGGESNISNRSWIRLEGKFLLLRDITLEDDGRVVECRVHQPDDTDNITSVGFYTIDLTQSSVPSLTGNEEDENKTENDNTYKVLFAVFFIMWVLTVAMISAWYMYPKTKSHWHPSRVSSYFSRRGKQRSDGEGTEHTQGMSEKMAEAENAEGRPNQNNSSSHDISEGGQGNRSPSIPDQPSANDMQQGGGNKSVENPVYFCVDRSPATIRSSWKSRQANHAKTVELEDDRNDLDPNDYDYVGLPHTNNVLGVFDSSVYADVRADLEPVVYGKVKK